MGSRFPKSTTIKIRVTLILMFFFENMVFFDNTESLLNPVYQKILTTSQRLKSYSMLQQQDRHDYMLIYAH